jgi:hypothetical protein
MMQVMEADPVVRVYKRFYWAALAATVAFGIVRFGLLG